MIRKRDTQAFRDQQQDAIDRNPSLPCGECGESFNWQDYWEARIIEGDRVDEPNNPDETWRCDECHEAHERRKRRKQKNKQLTEFSA